MCDRHAESAPTAHPVRLATRTATMKPVQCRWQRVGAVRQRAAVPGGAGGADQRLWPGAASRSTPVRVVKTLELCRSTGRATRFGLRLVHRTDLRQVQIPVLGRDDDRFGAWHGQSAVRRAGASCLMRHRFHRLGPALSTHPMFPAGTNVEFAQVEAPDRVRILDLGARRRSDDIVRDRHVGISGRGGGPRRRRPRGGRRRAWRHPARRVARGRRLSHRLGRAGARRQLAAREPSS